MAVIDAAKENVLLGGYAQTDQVVLSQLQWIITFGLIPSGLTPVMIGPETVDVMEGFEGYAIPIMNGWSTAEVPISDKVLQVSSRGEAIVVDS